jgi:hypothetical protein
MHVFAAMDYGSRDFDIALFAILRNSSPGRKLPQEK